jgi:hypothetical protein
MNGYNAAKLIEIVDPQAGRLRETVLNDTPAGEHPLFESGHGGRQRTLQEVAENNLSVFPQLLRDGLRAIMFDSYAGVAQTWQLWAQTQQSDKLAEDYLEESGIGILPEVGEGTAYPFIMQELDRTVSIANSKRGGRIKVTEEMIAFNRVGVLRQQAQMLGRSMAVTKEQLAYNLLTTGANYTRNSTTNDNDIGANTAATTFDAAGINLALSTLRTAKDRKSGIYLGVMPNTLICGPRLEFAAKQLLLAPEVSRQGGNTTNEIYGTGTANPFRGVVDQIIVSPFVQSYAWVLMERQRPVVYQTVWPLQLLQSSMSADNSTYLGFDALEYRAREFFGFGMLNDRFAFYSSSSTAPTVA